MHAQSIRKYKASAALGPERRLDGFICQGFIAIQSINRPILLSIFFEIDSALRKLSGPIGPDRLSYRGPVLLAEKHSAEAPLLSGGCYSAKSMKIPQSYRFIGLMFWSKYRGELAFFMLSEPSFRQSRSNCKGQSF